MQQDNLDEAALAVQNVQVDVLPDSIRSIYTAVRDATGVTGIGDTEQPQTDSSDESGEDEGDYSDESYYDESYYE